MAEPTYRMNEDILRPALEDAFKKYGMFYSWKASEDTYYTDYGKIILRTQDKRSALEGHNIAWFGLDEMDLLPKEKNLENWKTLISKLTKGKKQYGFGVGTNEGFEFIYEKFYKGSIKHPTKNIYSKGKEFKLFIASTLENKFNLPEGYIESLYDNYDEKLIQRYINGEFVNIKSGRAYSNFNDDNKVNKRIDFNKPLFMSWDVNYSDRRMSTTLIQEFQPHEVWKEVPDYVDKSKSVFVAVKGFYHPNTDSEIQCKIIKEWLKGYSNQILVYGDRTGNDRRVGAPRTHYQIVLETFGLSRDNLRTRTTRSIIDRVTTLNTMFKNSKGFRRVFVNQTEEDLITDLEQTTWKQNKNELDATNLERTDPSDSMSYYFYFEHDLLKGHTVAKY